ncbi:MAG: CooT family nickel-binding protein [Dehalococcoidia bacterium]|nr:MAG: CooT family nickel-binding protein [Dehalococcoidia bacterium]
MCLAKVYEDMESDKPILEDLAHVIIDDNRLELETLFGDRKVFLGKVREIDFVKSRVVIEKRS